MKDSGSSSVLVGSNANSYSYALSGKIMLASIIVVFSLVIVIVCFHSYARRSRRRQLHRQRQRHLLFNSDTTTATADAANTNTSKGLDSLVLKSLPTFNYFSNTHNPPLECAVCLSEFEENEMGRLLPKCKHCFHVQCIDMWFQSHSSCPLCRSPVQPIIVVSVSVTETVLSIDDHAEATDRNSGMYHQSCRMSCSASSPALASLQMEERERKPPPLQHVGISIEESPSMYERLKVLEEEMGSGYSRGHHGLKSPRGGGILSLKRIWSV